MAPNPGPGVARAGPRSCTWVPRAAVFHREGGAVLHREAGSGATSETWAAPPGSGASASVAGAYSEIAVGYLSVEARTGHLGGAIIGVGNSLLLSNDRSGVKIGLRDECGAGAEAGVNISIHGQLSFVIS